MSAPRLSIVIPSGVRADLLRRCLETVTTHTPADTEVIVVDDASSDEIVSRTASSFSSIRTLRLPRRSGFCVAANTGIRASTAPVVELLNDDTEVTSGWAEAALARFSDPRVVAVAPLVLQLDPGQNGPPIIDSAGDAYDPGGFATKRGRGVAFHSASDYRSPRQVWGVSATAGFYSRAALDRAGLFPEHFGAYFEDVDLSHRLRAVGEVWYEPASVVWHRVSASYGRRPNRRVLEQQSCNEERVFWRNVRGQSLVRNTLRHIAVLAGKSIRRLTEGQFTPWAMGRFRAWSSW